MSSNDNDPLCVESSYVLARQYVIRIDDDWNCGSDSEDVLREFAPMLLLSYSELHPMMEKKGDEDDGE